MHAWTEIALQVRVSIQIHLLQEVADAGLLTVCNAKVRCLDPAPVQRIVPYVDMGANDGTRSRCCPRTVPATDCGEVLPERSGDPSERIRAAASSKPVAFVFEDPIAGAAFWPSAPPMCNRCIARKAVEFVVETTDSTGLTGRSNAAGRSGASAESGGAVGLSNALPGGMEVRDVGLSRPFWVACNEELDPLMVANRRRRSSNGTTP